MYENIKILNMFHLCSDLFLFYACFKEQFCIVYDYTVILDFRFCFGYKSFCDRFCFAADKNEIILEARQGLCWSLWWMNMNNYDFSGLEQKIGYNYKNKSLLRQAMTHTSFANEQKINKLDSYERIEFLGDAVLEMVSSEYFYFEKPETTEGNLTKMRASAVCEPSLAITARELELGKYLLLGKGEEATGGRERDSIIADAVEESQKPKIKL